MHRWIAPLALTLVFAACMHRIPVDEAAFYEPYEEPLEARILPFGTLSFVINRPAHVAIFEIVPGRLLEYPLQQRSGDVVRPLSCCLMRGVPELCDDPLIAIGRASEEMGRDLACSDAGHAQDFGRATMHDGTLHLGQVRIDRPAHKWVDEVDGQTGREDLRIAKLVAEKARPILVESGKFRHVAKLR